MKPVWVTVAARPAVGFLAREVRAEMTALSASTAASASASGLARRNKMDAARAGRWLPTAADGPVGGLAETLACSRRYGHGTGTVARAVRLLPASTPTAVACCARRARPRRGRRTAPDCINFARRIRRRGGQRAPRVRACSCRMPRICVRGSAAISDATIRPAPLMRCSLPEVSEQCSVRCRQHQPGQSGHSKAPWTIRQDHPGGKAPAMRTHHAS